MLGISGKLKLMFGARTEQEKWQRKRIRIRLEHRRWRVGSAENIHSRNRPGPVAPAQVIGVTHGEVGYEQRHENAIEEANRNVQGTKPKVVVVATGRRAKPPTIIFPLRKVPIDGDNRKHTLGEHHAKYEEDGDSGDRAGHEAVLKARQALLRAGPSRPKIG